MSTTRTPHTTQHPSPRAPATGRPGWQERVVAVAAGLAILGLAAGLPAGLVAIRPVAIPAWLNSPAALQVVLAGGDPARLGFIAGYGVAWIVWAVLAGMLVREIARQARQLRHVHVKMPAVPRGVLGKLVATASMTFTSLPAVTALPAVAAQATLTAPTPDDFTGSDTGTGTATLDGDSGAARHDRPDAESGSTSPGTAAPSPSSSDRRVERELERHVVRHGETLWDLAEQRLGNGARYAELHELNRGVLGPDPGFLRAGTVLRLPPVPDPTSPPEPATTAGRTDSTQDAGTEGKGRTYTVRAGDTLSSIALKQLGDAGRYEQIADASRDTVQPDGRRLTNPDHIRPGWILTLPSPNAEPATRTTATNHTPTPDASPTADPGDASTAPAKTDPGKADRSSADAQPAPGQGMTTPADPRSQAGGSPAPEPPLPETSAPPNDVDREGIAADVGDQESASQDVSPWWLLGGVATGGAVLAVGLHTTITWGRRRQARYRRPGRMVPPIPAKLAAASTTARVLGTRHGPDLERVHRLLLALGAPHLADGTPRPPLAWAELTPTEAIVHLAGPATLPSPWTGRDEVWSARLDEAPEAEDVDRDWIVPYPMLVSIGTAAEHAILLDLERAGTVAVTGEPDLVAGLGRHLVAQLALNPWVRLLSVDLLGDIAPDPTRLRPGLVRQHTDSGFLDQLTDYVRLAAQEAPAGEDHEELHAVITTANHPTTHLAAAIHAHPGRAGTALITLSPAAGPPVSEPEAWVPADAAAPGLVLDLADGRLRVPALGLDLEPAGLSECEFSDCADLAALTDRDTDAPNPLADQLTGRTTPPRTDPIPADPVLAEQQPLDVDTPTSSEPTDSTLQDMGSHPAATPGLETDFDGAPTVPGSEGAVPASRIADRPADPAIPAGEGSILPAADNDYLTHTANTREDLAQLAPVIEQATEDTGTDPDSPSGSKPEPDEDSALDRDLDDWWDGDSHRPKIEVLGPVAIDGAGDPKEISRRKHAIIAMIAFIVFHPPAVSRDQLADMTGFDAGTIASHLAAARRFFGPGPDGKEYLPRQRPGRPKAGQPAPGQYRLTDHLCDANLVARLYARAIRRGAGGLGDLEAALELVRGAPFTVGDSPDRWSWALDGENLAAQYAGLIGDAAHLVITRALSTGDLPLARRARQTWTTADPDSEALAADSMLIDLAQHDPAAARAQARELWHRHVDATGPGEPSDRTRELVLARHPEIVCARTAQPAEQEKEAAS